MHACCRTHLCIQALCRNRQVHCDARTADILRERGYDVESRGSLALKGLNDMNTFWVRGGSRLPDRVQRAIDGAVELASEQLRLLREDQQMLWEDSHAKALWNVV